MWDLEWPSIKDLIHKHTFLPQSASPACVHTYSCHYVNPVVSSSCLQSLNGKKGKRQRKINIVFGHFQDFPILGMLRTVKEA